MAQLSQPNGLVHGIVDVSTLFGVVALALFAGADCHRVQPGDAPQPARPRTPAGETALAGTFLALALFALIALILAFAVGVAIAFAVGPGKGVDTSAWTSSTGINDTLQSLFHVYLTTLGYGLIGMGLAVLLRSPAVAIGLGVAYALPGEAIINAIWDNGDRWLPVQLLSAVAHGGTSTTSYGRALLLGALYAALIAAGTLMLFTRRDV